MQPYPSCLPVPGLVTGVRVYDSAGLADCGWALPDARRAWFGVPPRVNGSASLPVPPRLDCWDAHASSYHHHGPLLPVLPPWVGQLQVGSLWRILLARAAGLVRSMRQPHYMTLLTTLAHFHRVRVPYTTAFGQRLDALQLD